MRLKKLLGTKVYGFYMVRCGSTRDLNLSSTVVRPARGVRQAALAQVSGPS